MIAKVTFNFVLGNEDHGITPEVAPATDFPEHVRVSDTVMLGLLQAQVFTQVRNWHLVQKVTPQNRNLLFSSPLDDASTSETTIAVTTPVKKRYRAF